VSGLKSYFYCEVCGEETEHTVVSERRHLYRCVVCGNHEAFPPEKEIMCRAIISHEGESERGIVRLRSGEVVEKGEEMVVETESGFRIGEVTSLELRGGARSEIGEAENISTVWLRDIGEVAVKFSLHKRAITTPITIYMPGESRIRIGEDIEVEGKIFKITKIKTRDGKVVDRDRDEVVAKDVKRVYAMFERKVRKGK
jgi:uncharacterized Zn finger protein